MARWGTFGQPVLLFPTAGGDCEEIERFLMIKVLAPLIDAGKIKVYSCDSVAGSAMVTREGSPGHRQWVLNQFHQYIRHELVPAIRKDCNAENIEIFSAGRVHRRLPRGRGALPLPRRVQQGHRHVGHLRHPPLHER